MDLKYELLVPEYLLAALAAGLVALDLLAPNLRRQYLAYLAALGLLAVLALSLLYVGQDESFGQLIRVDNFTAFFRVVFILTALVVCLMSPRYVGERLLHPGEYYGLIVLSTIGAIYMAAAQELLTAYIALELLSFSFYVLVSYAKFDQRSNEGGMKYMLLGAFSSAILLYGLSLIYGATGSTGYAAMTAAVEAGLGQREAPFLVGLVLVLTGLGFKVAAVPFHMWTPDAYEGAPLPVTAYLSAASKAAGFALLLRLFAGPLLPAVADWRWLVAGLAAASMLLGNLVAIQQSNIKRLLAYSSIGQVGYMLMGIAALGSGSAAAPALVLHLAGYVVSNLAAFACAIYYYNLTGRESIYDYGGLAERQPFLAVAMSVALFSLAGMPLFAGFTTKFILFQAVAAEGMLWLAGIAVLMSFVSLYYYLVVVKQMYLVEPESPSRFRLGPLEYGVLAALVVGVLFIGLYPQPLLNAAETSTRLLYLGSQALVSSGVAP